MKRGKTMRVDRRNFLKILGAGAPVAAFSCADRERAEKLADGSEPVRDADLRWDKAPCRFCGTGCGVEVGIKDGRVRAVRGDEASPVNKGLLCVKGYHLPAFMAGEDRLTHPIRRHPDGGEERISWDDALDLIASEYSKALEA
ncbi:MAG: periplasmic nitrate reductase subunit alpha, partial [Acidobacteriota bacterium]